MLIEHWERLAAAKREYSKTINLANQGQALILNNQVGLWFFIDSYRAKREERLLITAPRSLAIYQANLLDRSNWKKKPTNLQEDYISALTVSFNNSSRRKVVYIGEEEYKLSYWHLSRTDRLAIKVESTLPIVQTPYDGPIDSLREAVSSVWQPAK